MTTTKATATVVLVVFLFMLDACSRTQPHANLAPQFKEKIKKNKELVFIDSSHLGASMDGAILSLHFFADSKVHLYTWGNGFSNYPGTYAFTENNGIDLSFADQRWPRLRLSKQGDLLALGRRDGLKALEKSYVHTDENGTRREVDDGDIYPEARPLIFPLIQRIPDTKQGPAK
ncbi:hypothetical protein [Prosthecobacter sp.]|uniref:hypothetical protein n=1 Tax=Prosthecobacter sp. TaxID=1965333 RepID=UPI003782E897